MSKKTEIRLAWVCVVFGLILVALAILSPGPLLGFGSAPLAFPAFVFGLTPLLGGLLTLIYYRFKKST